MAEVPDHKVTKVATSPITLGGVSYFLKGVPLYCDGGGGYGSGVGTTGTADVSKETLGSYLVGCKGRRAEAAHV